MNPSQDTIVAIATPPDKGAIGVVRISGPAAIPISDRVFSKDLRKAAGYTLHYGHIVSEGELIDEVLLSVFRAPHSYTREDVVEISCHGSPFILQQVMQLLLDGGARLAEPGEFTRRAWLQGAMDLAQAEAVADLIASTSRGAHRLAMSQLRGGVSQELKALRTQLLDFTSLIELELDFAEEDVAFADRSQLQELVDQIYAKLESLIESFRLGNALKQGVPTVILGKPNAGKSTLLNTLLNENRAIVSDTPGTTRDVIEDRIVLDGIEFRLMDTAGVRRTSNPIEREGVTRALTLAREAQMVIYLFDVTSETPRAAVKYIQSLDLPHSTLVLLVGNKLDQLGKPKEFARRFDMALGENYHGLLIAAKFHTSLEELRALMVSSVRSLTDRNETQPLISSVRHHTALKRAKNALIDVDAGLRDGLSGDLMAIDIRTVLHYIGEITGEISTEEVLGNIFGKFCIGK